MSITMPGKRRWPWKPTFVGAHCVCGARVFFTLAAEKLKLRVVDCAGRGCGRRRGSGRRRREGEREEVRGPLRTGRLAGDGGRQKERSGKGLPHSVSCLRVASICACGRIKPSMKEARTLILGAEGAEGGARARGRCSRNYKRENE